MVCAPLSSDFVYSQSSVDAMLLLINPLRMRSRVRVVCLCVCVSVTVLTARVLILAVQSW